jgi:hypothetical protein
LADLALLLPPDESVTAAILNGAEVPFDIDAVEGSHYLRIDAVPAGVNELEITLETV